MINAVQVIYRRSVPLRSIAVLFYLLALTALESSIYAQQTTDKPPMGTSLLLQFFGPEALGVHVNHNVTPRFALNVGLGVGLDAHIGINAYLTDRARKRFAWYGGLQAYLIREVVFNAGSIFGDSGSSGSRTKDTQLGLYLPIGFEYMAKKGFTLQLDIGPNIVGDDWNQSNTAPIMGSLKVGYTFRSK